MFYALWNPQSKTYSEVGYNAVSETDLKDVLVQHLKVEQSNRPIDITTLHLYELLEIAGYVKHEGYNQFPKNNNSNFELYEFIN